MSRLARSTRVWVAVFLVLFALMFIALFVNAVWLQGNPPDYVPQPTPTVSPGHGVGHGPYFGMEAP